jgi:hypothetical protein
VLVSHFAPPVDWIGNKYPNGQCSIPLALSS